MDNIFSQDSTLWGLVQKEMRQFYKKAVKALSRRINIFLLKVAILVTKGQKLKGPAGKIDVLQAKINK